MDNLSHTHLMFRKNMIKISTWALLQQGSRQSIKPSMTPIEDSRWHCWKTTHRVGRKGFENKGLYLSGVIRLSRFSMLYRGTTGNMYLMMLIMIAIGIKKTCISLNTTKQGTGDRCIIHE